MKLIKFNSVGPLGTKIPCAINPKYVMTVTEMGKNQTNLVLHNGGVAELDETFENVMIAFKLER